MKVVACMKVFNEEDVIWNSIMSIYPYVDKIYIIESCFVGMEKIIHPSRMRAPGLSGDDTYNILNHIVMHQDPDRKIEWEQLGYVNGDQTIIYNKFVDSVEVGDVIWMVDGDEVYQGDLANWMRVQMDERNYHAFWLPNRLYWQDWYHRRTDPGWCRPHQRAYVKIDDSFHYEERNLDVRWTDERQNVYGFGKPPKGTHYRGRDYQTFVGEDDFYAYHHYAYVKTEQRMLEKLVSQYIQNEEPQRAGEYEHCQKFRDPIEFKLETHSWFTGEFPDDIVGVTSGEHPVEMNEHMWKRHHWKLGSSTLGYEAARKLLSFDMERGAQPR